DLEQHCSHIYRWRWWRSWRRNYVSRHRHGSWLCSWFRWSDGISLARNLRQLWPCDFQCPVLVRDRAVGGKSQQRLLLLQQGLEHGQGAVLTFQKLPVQLGRLFAQFLQRRQLLLDQVERTACQFGNCRRGGSMIRVLGSIHGRGWFFLL